VIDRRAFIGAVAGGLLAAPLAVEAQQAGKVPRIGYLSGGSPSGAPQLKVFRETLLGLGWVEGQNISIEESWAEGQYDRLPGLAAALVNRNVDVILVASTPEIRAAKQATSTIPIVMAIGADPVGQGFISSLRRPGGNVTGMAWDPDPAVAEKYFEFLKELVPGLQRVGVIIDRAQPNTPYRDAGVQAAPKLGLTLYHAEVGAPNEIEQAFALVARAGAQAVFVHGSALFFTERRQIATLAAKHRLAAIYFAKGWVEAGGLMSYGPSLPDLYRSAARYVDRILKGAKPGDLPVEQATKFELAINLKTAKALGLTIPPSLLQRADQVIE